MVCHFKNFREQIPAVYYTPSAQIIAGSLKAPQINIKSKGDRESMIHFLEKNSTNRLNFFAYILCKL